MAATATAKPASSGRMTLAAVTKTASQAPPRILLYGVEGIGKTTFAAKAPNPIFVGPEDGTGRITVARFPLPETWGEVLEAVATLEREKHDFKTLVLDTLDWLEPMLWRKVCADGDKDGPKANIEEFGYGKGYQVALDGWRDLLARLERLRASRGVGAIFLAHSQIRLFKNPEGEDFDRYELKLNAKASGLIKEWSDAVLFANHETFANKDKKTKRVRGVSTGARLIYTQRTAAYDAKTRYELPESLPLDWDEFASALKAGKSAEPDRLIAEIERKIADLASEDLKDRARAALGRAGKDAEKLSQLNNWLNAKIGEES